MMFLRLYLYAIITIQSVEFQHELGVMETDTVKTKSFFLATPVITIRVTS